VVGRVAVKKQKRKGRYTPEQLMARAELKKSEDALKAGLKVLPSEEADEIIGEPGPGYKELLDATQDNFGLLYAGLCQMGLRKSNRAAETVGKGITMQLAMIHVAYALGVQKGEERGRETTTG
jgi:hypothetical protein